MGSRALKQDIKRISIVTVCRNAEQAIAETMQSVLHQTAVLSGRVELDYQVRDGASTDRTVETARSLQTPAVDIVSEPDAGLYDGLARALPRCRGDVVAYLNAGDYYHPRAFDVVLDVMETHPVDWLTGMTVLYNERSQVIGCSQPYRYRRRLIRRGLYGPLLPFIQQEATFWRRSLHRWVDFDRLASLRHAGDAFLWFSFADAHELAIVQSYLGGFKYQRGQISEDKPAYFDEMRRFSETPSVWDRTLARIDKRRWYRASKRRRFDAGHYAVFDLAAQRWSMTPRR